MTDSAKPTLAFCFEVCSPYGTRQAQITIATVNDSLTPSYANDYNKLIVIAYMDDEYHRSGFYGQRVTCEAGRIDLDEAQGIVRQLAKIEKHMARLSERFGRPQTLSAFLLHLGDALGIKKIGYIERTPNGRVRVATWLPLAGSTHRIDELEQECRSKRDAA